MEQFGTNSKVSLGCNVSQIRPRGGCFETEISLFMMFVYGFTLFISLSLIFLNIQIK